MRNQFTIAHKDRSWKARKIGFKNGMLHAELRDRRSLPRGLQVTLTDNVDPKKREWTVVVTSMGQILLEPH